MKKVMKLDNITAQVLQMRRDLKFTPLAVVIKGPDDFGPVVTPTNNPEQPLPRRRAL